MLLASAASSPTKNSFLAPWVSSFSNFKSAILWQAWVKITSKNRSYVSGSRRKDEEGGIPVLVEKNQMRLADIKASWTNVPTDFGFRMT